MMRSYALAAIALALAGVTACADDSITLELSRERAPADGETLVEVSARVTSLGIAAADGTRVWFRASEPALFVDPESARPQVTGALADGARELEVEVRGGVARVEVRAPIDEGTIELDARYNNQDGTSIAASTVLEFAPPPPVSSGTRVGAGTAVPQFVFDCDADRMGAFVGDRPDIIVLCTVVTRDHDDHALPHAPVRLFAEAGELGELPATADAPRLFYYRVPGVLESLPIDVRPLAGEADYAIEGAGLIPGALEQNPRDGLVTLLAVVRGHEAYTDLDGNGRWDPDEPFVDEGEPFLDVDDDGVWDPAIDGAHCCDNDGNGEVDGPNGTWDDDVWLGRVVHVMWTGPIAIGEGRSALSPAEPAIDAGGETTLELSLVDANFNPVSFNGADDRLEINGTGPIALSPNPGIEISRAIGFPVRDRFPAFRFDGPPCPDDAELEVDGARRWPLLVRDDRADPQCSGGAWTLWVDVFASPAGGDAMPTARDRLEVSGTLGACSPP